MSGRAAVADLVPSDWLDGADGLWHVTVARDRVMAEGLRSRRQLGQSVQGLGGGRNDQAPDRVSLTWSSAKAAEIEVALRLAIRAARGEARPSEIFAATAERYGTDWFGCGVRAVLAGRGAPSAVLEDEWLTGVDEWLDAAVPFSDGYRLLQELDDAMEAEFDRDNGELPSRVGLTAPAEVLATLDPEQVCVLAVAVRAGAVPEVVVEEAELRFVPADLVVLGLASGLVAPVEVDAAPHP